jgi:hypothetical protein
MKNSDIHRLLTYDQTSDASTPKDYLSRLPTTLLYPKLTKAGVDAYIETIERAYITPLDLQTWQQLQLFLLEPEWLQSSSHRKLRSIVYERLKKNTCFIKNIIEQYSEISSFGDSCQKQEALLFTVASVINISENIPSMCNEILQYKNGVLQTIKENPDIWSKFIQGSDWLIEELQAESGILFNFLQQVAMIKSTTNKSTEPTDIIQQAMDMWASNASNQDLQRANQNINRINDILKDVLGDIKSGKRLS